MHSPVFLLLILFALGFNNQEKGVLARKSDDCYYPMNKMITAQDRADIECMSDRYRTNI